MNHESYFVVCNPCNEQVIAKDVLLLNTAGYKPKISRELMNDEYIPLVIFVYYGRIYKCPQCETSSGVLAPLAPRNLKLFSHTYTCSNKNKFPVEV